MTVQLSTPYTDSEPDNAQRYRRTGRQRDDSMMPIAHRTAHLTKNVHNVHRTGGDRRAQLSMCIWLKVK